MSFLVFHTDPVVLLDMIGIMRNAWPNSVIESAMTLTDARKAIERFSELSGALIAMPVEELDKTGLPHVIEQKHGRIVLPYFGEQDLHQEIAGRGWVPLRVPFTDETVREALLNAGIGSR